MFTLLTNQSHSSVIDILGPIPPLIFLARFLYANLLLSTSDYTTLITLFKYQSSFAVYRFLLVFSATSVSFCVVFSATCRVFCWFSRPVLLFVVSSLPWCSSLLGSFYRSSSRGPVSRGFYCCVRYRRVVEIVRVSSITSSTQ